MKESITKFRMIRIICAVMRQEHVNNPAMKRHVVAEVAPQLNHRTPLPNCNASVEEKAAE